MRKTLTTSQVAKRWGSATKTVVSHIRSGELQAFDLSTSGSRPRFAIPEEALERFEKSRMVVA